MYFFVLKAFSGEQGELCSSERKTVHLLLLIRLFQNAVIYCGSFILTNMWLYMYYTYKQVQ